MLSEKQLIANRNNCLKSTGPRTLGGKIIASRNTVRHGLLSDSGFDPSENRIIAPKTFQSIPGLRRTEKEFPPVTDGSSAQTLGCAVRQDFQNSGLLERLLRYEGQIERNLYRALTELQKFQFLRRRNDAINVDEASVLHNNSDISSGAGDYPDSISVKSVVPVSPQDSKPNKAILIRMPI
jgi:hypothetical protein